MSSGGVKRDISKFSWILFLGTSSPYWQRGTEGKTGQVWIFWAPSPFLCGCCFMTEEWSSSSSCRFPCCWLWQRDLGVRSTCWNPTLIGIGEVQATILGQGGRSQPPSCSRWCLLLLHRTAVRCHIAVIAHDWHLWGHHRQPSSLMTHCRGVGAISSFLRYSASCRHPWQPWKHASWWTTSGRSLAVVCTPFWDSLLWGILVLIWHKEHQGNKNFKKPNKTNNNNKKTQPNKKIQNPKWSKKLHPKPFAVQGNKGNVFPPLLGSSLIRIY